MQCVALVDYSFVFSKGRSYDAGIPVCYGRARTGH